MSWLSKINIALGGIALILTCLCIGLTVYYKQVDVAQETFVRTLQQTINPEGAR